jgi:urea ABC transporter ATP-binding protein UrtE
MLEVLDLHAGYGPVPVLTGISLTLKDGEILTVLGRNGAGKTTLMRAIAGALPTTSGNTRLAGATITGLPPYRIARQGLAYVPQGRGIFPKLTVEENLTIGTRAQGARGGRIPRSVYDHFPILAERRAQLGGTLSGGQQQQLAIGRALCGDPRLLLLDEPSEGIQPNIVQQIRVFLRAVVAEGSLSVLLVEQNLELGLKVADRCIVIEKGRVVHEALPSEFENEEVLRRFLAI